MTETATAAEPVIYEANTNFFTHPAAFCEAYAAWLEAHGIDRNSTYRTEHLVIDAPLVRVFQYERNMQGRLYTEESTGEVAVRPPFDVLIRTPAPSPADFAQAADHA